MSRRPKRPKRRAFRQLKKALRQNNHDRIGALNDAQSDGPTVRKHAVNAVRSASKLALNVALSDKNAAGCAKTAHTAAQRLAEIAAPVQRATAMLNAAPKRSIVHRNGAQNAVLTGSIAAQSAVQTA